LCGNRSVRSVATFVTASRSGTADEWSAIMSTIAHARVSAVRPLGGAMFRRLVAHISRREAPLKPYIQTAASILFFTGIMAVLLGTKAAVMLSRMHGL